MSYIKHAIPLIVLAIVAGSIYYEIDISAFESILVAMGIGGIPLSIAQRAIKMKQEQGKDVSSIIDTLKKMKLSDTKQD